jgi:hypothetical protein
MNEFLDMFSTFAGVQVIFKLGYVPQDDEYYELTPEEYDKFYATMDTDGISPDEKIYMLLPNDTQKYSEVAAEDVFVFTEKNISAIKQAAQLIEQYCEESGKTFKDYEEKMSFAATLLPDFVLKGTIYDGKGRKMKEKKKKIKKGTKKVIISFG